MKKEWEEEYVTQFSNMQKLITNIWKIMIKTKNHHIWNIGMWMIYVVEKCQKSCWLSKIVKATIVKNISQFGRYEGFSLEVDVQYSENLHELHNDLPFLPERMKIE